MRKVRAALSVLVSAALCLNLCLLSGCTTKEVAHSIYLVTDGQQGYYWENLIEGAKAAAEDSGWEIKVVPYGAETDMQAHMNAAKSMDADCVITSAFTERSRMQRMEQTDSENPELIVMGMDTGETWAATRIVFDQNGAGKQVAQQLAQHIGLQKDYLLVTDTAAYNYWDDWEVSLRSNLGAQGSRVIRRINCAQNEESAYRQCLQELEKLGEQVDGIICAGEMGTRGALRAVRQLGVQVPIMGAEFDDEIALGIRDGIVCASFVHNAYGCGYMSVERAVHIINGRESESRVTLETLYVDAQNMFDEELLPFLYEIE